MSPAPPLKLIDLPGLDQRIMDDSMVSGCKWSSLQFRILAECIFFGSLLILLVVDGALYGRF